MPSFILTHKLQTEPTQEAKSELRSILGADSNQRYKVGAPVSFSRDGFEITAAISRGNYNGTYIADF